MNILFWKDQNHADTPSNNPRLFPDFKSSFNDEDSSVDLTQFLRIRSHFRIQIRGLLTLPKNKLIAEGNPVEEDESALQELRIAIRAFKDLEDSAFSWQDIHGGDKTLVERAEDRIRKLEGI